MIPNIKSTKIIADFVVIEANINISEIITHYEDIKKISYRHMFFELSISMAEARLLRKT